MDYVMAAQVGGVEMKSQKEVTLRNDLSLDDRLGVYRNFFIYCMTGHVTVLPMGATSTPNHLVAWTHKPCFVEGALGHINIHGCSSLLSVTYCCLSWGWEAEIACLCLCD